MDNDQKSSGEAFNIGFDEKVARPPQSLSLFKNKQDDKEPLTLDKIEEKQQLANRRRQVLKLNETVLLNFYSCIIIIMVDNGSPCKSHADQLLILYLLLKNLKVLMERKLSLS